MHQAVANILSLFGSLSTLVCCALPSLLVTLGLGTVVASMVSAMPWLVWLSQNKKAMFLLAGFFIGLNFVLVYRPQGKIACAVGGNRACEEAKAWNRRLLWLSIALYGVGVFMTYGALPLLRFLDR